MISFKTQILQSTTNKFIFIIIIISIFISLHFIPSILKIFYTILYNIIYGFYMILCLITCIPLGISWLYILVCLEDLICVSYDIITTISLVDHKENYLGFKVINTVTTNSN
ncbi:hypothetical protein ACTFIU_007770 [Dictyostelium citrinum]